MHLNKIQKLLTFMKKVMFLVDSVLWNTHSDPDNCKTMNCMSDHVILNKIKVTPNKLIQYRGGGGGILQIHLTRATQTHLEFSVNQFYNRNFYQMTINKAIYIST